MRKVGLGVVAFLVALLLCVGSAQARDVTLAWDASAGPDLAGYKLYYKIGSGGAPYDGTGLTEGDSPIDVGDVLQFTLNGLTPGIYYFVATAYDTSNRESDYSNEVNTRGPAPPGTLRIQVTVTESGAVKVRIAKN